MLTCLLFIIIGYLIGVKIDKARNGKLIGTKVDKHSGKIIGGIIGLLISVSLLMIMMSLKPEWMLQPEIITRERATLLELSKPKESDAEIIFSSTEFPQLRNLSFRTKSGEIKHKSALKLHEEIFVYEGNSEKTNLLITSKTKEPPWFHWLVIPTKSITTETFEVILPGKVSEKKVEDRKTCTLTQLRQKHSER